MSDLFSIKPHTFTLEKLWVHYEACLKAHDWTYEYSDDFRVWSRGSRESDYVKHLLHVLSKSDSDRANALYNKYKIG